MAASMKQPTQPVCWLGRSSSGMDPVVSYHTWPSGHFTCCTKNNKTTDGGRKKKKKTKHEFRTAKRRKVKLSSF